MDTKYKGYKVIYVILIILLFSHILQLLPLHTDKREDRTNLECILMKCFFFFHRNMPCITRHDEPVAKPANVESKEKDTLSKSCYILPPIKYPDGTLGWVLCYM